MITEETCYVGNCDNCGETYRNEHHGFTMFIDKSQCLEYMDKDDWYTGHADPDHKGKYYCPDCFEHDPDIDDKIVVDLSRTKK